jgi:hypothetical protein
MQSAVLAPASKAAGGVIAGSRCNCVEETQFATKTFLEAVKSPGGGKVIDADEDTEVYSMPK